MKTKRIWIWSLVFGMVAALVAYVGVFSDKSQATNSAPIIKADSSPKEKKEEKKEPEKRDMKNQILKVSDGKRAISLKVLLEQGVSGYVEPNSHVDIIAYETHKDVKAKKEYRSSVLVMQNVRVLTSGKSVDGPEEALRYETVTVEVTPDEGLKLSLAALDKDGFYLMLRNDSDKAIKGEPLKHMREIIKEGADDNEKN
ncbi:RcpC/CpaB family pilus assembly protein [Fictibacillus sp. b24]|uniref:RcpC/CpaB family pilus assembly protein n=1 Tax=Fictibacillus sp. b24 TaxID=3055863 RepID=UPI0025A28ECB|nr:RcpC/CpaB family pilus assembly protein [Fictibacillus sp. b24]MDM5314864.1 RcpC/CpaB family pilus assembly protein [Fictibacillus sp. b24]